MKIKDLINKLKMLDSDLDVFVDGYEGGFDLATGITQQELYKVEKEKWHSGTFHNCLLYTSPSPRDGLLSRMPSSA